MELREIIIIGIGAAAMVWWTLFCWRWYQAMRIWPDE